MTSTPWTIWRSGAGDLEHLISLEKDAFGARSWGANSLKESYGAPGVTVLLGGRAKSDPGGFALLRGAGHEAEILTLGVGKSMQNQGLGQALLIEMMRMAKAGGADTMFLEVDATNKAAITLYENAGFIQSGHRKKYYRDGADALVMAVTLSLPENFTEA